MEEISGFVSHIVYHNAENGYTVFELSEDGDETVCVGILPVLNEGEYIRAQGEYTEHPLYGMQLKISSCRVEYPQDEKSVERYLGSGVIKGVGPKLAAKIVGRFGKETFHVIEEEPQRLAQIKGISERMAQEIYRQFFDQQDLRQATMFLAEYGISAAYAMKIHQAYGSRLYDIIREDPYRLAEDITGIGFKLADNIAQKAGIGGNSPQRIRSGIIYILQQGAGEGHTCLPRQQVIVRAAQLLDVDEDEVKRHLEELGIDRKLLAKELDGEPVIYIASYYYMELEIAARLTDLNMTRDLTELPVEAVIRRIEQEEKLDLDEKQRQAVMEAAGGGVMVITGGPGTGKTTTINALIRYFEYEGLDITLAAPTGRAAKRMAEATGREASTIHRLLEPAGSPQDPSHVHFARNAQNPLETDVLIIDEMSMVDIHLMHALLKAVLPGTRLVLVGDVNQLPSVGPGNVLKDIIRSGCFRVVMLKKIFRQARTSNIVTNAHKINAGILPDLDDKATDFFCMKRYDAASVTGVMIALIRDKLPPNIGASAAEIQVLTPMRKGELGVERLNAVLQQYLNPPAPDKRELPHREAVWREGDKVMQIRNNYQLEWKVTTPQGYLLRTGAGIFNGDMGTIAQINTFAQTVTVIFDEERRVVYTYGQLDELELAYAVTIHKSQGSEYAAVILPLLGGPRMLLNRNLLYTAVTRAKKCVVIVGSEETVQRMVANADEQKRYSGLRMRLEEEKERTQAPERSD